MDNTRISSQAHTKPLLTKHCRVPVNMMWPSAQSQPQGNCVKSHEYADGTLGSLPGERMAQGGKTLGGVSV